MKKNLLTISCFSAMMVRAQQMSKVKGTVMNSSGKAIENLEVRAVSKDNLSEYFTTQTNADSIFSIESLSSGKAYNFTFSDSGYATNEVNNFIIKEGKANSIMVRLDKVSSLDELVIVGYGDRKKKFLTSSISKLKTNDVEQKNVSTASQILQGQVAGVNLTIANGTPGTKNRGSIRGVSSINGDNEPLYVIDGIILFKIYCKL